jgi:hypothetical protein
MPFLADENILIDAANRKLVVPPRTTGGAGRLAMEAVNLEDLTSEGTRGIMFQPLRKQTEAP